MFKSTLNRVKINSFEFAQIRKVLSALHFPDEFFTFSVKEEKGEFFFQFQEVESTGLQIPFRTGQIFWLDAETGLIFKSVSSAPFYTPIFNLQKLVEKSGFDWEDFLKSCVTTFNANCGIDFNNALKFLSSLSSISYDTGRSLSSNYLSLSQSKDKKSNELQKFISDLTAELNSSFFSTVNVKGILGIHQTSVRSDGFDYLLLENSFQANLLKDFMGAISMDFSPSHVTEKMKKLGINETLKKCVFNPLIFTDYVKEKGSSSTSPVGKINFPYDTLESQLSKVVRRFKIKGIV